MHGREGRYLFGKRVVGTESWICEVFLRNACGEGVVLVSIIFFRSEVNSKKSSDQFPDALRPVLFGLYRA